MTGAPESRSPGQRAVPSVSQAVQQADEERRALQFGFEGTLARELVDMDVVRAQTDPVRTLLQHKASVSLAPRKRRAAETPLMVQSTHVLLRAAASKTCPPPRQ